MHSGNIYSSNELDFLIWHYVFWSVVLLGLAYNFVEVIKYVRITALAENNLHQIDAHGRIRL